MSDYRVIVEFDLHVQADSEKDARLEAITWISETSWESNPPDIRIRLMGEAA